MSNKQGIKFVFHIIYGAVLGGVVSYRLGSHARSVGISTSRQITLINHVEILAPPFASINVVTYIQIIRIHDTALRWLIGIS